MKKYKINQIFYSIQAEGFHSGLPAIFIRFAGCNLNCSFCDEKDLTFLYMSIEDIVGIIKSWKSQHVILTGGEPMLQLNKKFVERLLSEGCILHLETNGTVKAGFLKLIHWITVSPKERWKLKRGNELKIIYTGKENLHKLRRSTDFSHYYLQPCYQMYNEKEAVEIVKKNKDWRLSIQWHKMINIK